jgi:1,4-dihydroxy-2-naphthoyl-CoA synthase
VAKVELEARDDGVRLVTLTDPDRRNAMGDEMGAELLDAAREVAGDGDARALVVTGAGSAFCAGADLSAGGEAFARERASPTEHRDGGGRVTLRLFDLKKPVIAAQICQMPMSVVTVSVTMRIAGAARRATSWSADASATQAAIANALTAAFGPGNLTASPLTDRSFVISFGLLRLGQKLAFGEDR